MRHRSVIAFIILAAALVAAPQVAHDFASLKSAVGARIRGEILRAFLNLHAGEGAGELKTRRADAAPMLASCKAEAKADEQAARAEQRRDEERAQAATRDEGDAQVAPRAEAATQADAHRQLAMLIVPSPEVEEPSAAPPGVDDLFIHGKAEGLPRRAETSDELAMLIPPGLGFDVRYSFNAPRDAGLGAAGVGAQAARADTGRRSSAEERRRTDEGRRSSEESSRRASSQEAHSVTVAAPRFETAALSRIEVSSKFQGEEVLKNLGPLVREAVWTRAAQGGMKVRVFKVRCKAGASPAGAPRAPIQISADE
jgi:hypothetical protein